MKIPSRYWSSILCGFIGLALSLWLYLPTVNFNFIEFDDHLHVYENEAIKALDGAHLKKMWAEAPIRMYVPIAQTLWAAEYALAKQDAPPLDFAALNYGLHPSVFHATSVLLHMANIALLFFLILRLGLPSLAAVAGAGLFALHPLQMEAVSWVSAQRDPLAMLFSLSCLYLLAGSLRPGRVVGASLCFVLACLSKPSAVGLLLIAPLMVWLAPRLRGETSPGFQTLNGKLLGPAWGFCLMVAIGLIALTRSLEADVTLFAEPNFFQRLWIALDALGFYIERLILPQQVAGLYAHSPSAALASISYRPFLPLLLVTALAFLPRRMLGLGLLALFVAALLPLLGLTSFSFQNISTVANRYAYFAMLAPALALAWLVSRWPLRPLPQMVASLSILGIFVALFASASRIRGTWKDTFSYYEEALSRTPSPSWMAHYGYAAALLKRNQLNPARHHYEKAWTLEDKNVATAIDLGITLQRLDENEEAIRYYKLALERDPKALSAQINIASILSTAQKPGEALPYLEQALRIEPKSSLIHFNIGIVLAQLQRWEDARRHLEETLRIEPGAKLAAHNLAIVLGRLQQASGEAPRE